MEDIVYVVKANGWRVDVSFIADIFLTANEAEKFVKRYQKRNKDFRFDVDEFEVSGEVINNILLGDK